MANAQDTPSTVRPAGPADADAVVRLWMQFLAEQAGHDARFAVAEDALLRWQNDYPVWLDDGTRRLLVAEQEGVAVGFATAHRWAPPPIYAYTSEVFIDALFVQPHVRGQGVGAQLVAALRRWAAAVGAERLRLHVLAENAAGQAFWQRQDARPFSVSMTIELPPEAPEPPAATQKGRLGFG